MSVILVTGSRDWKDSTVIISALREAMRTLPPPYTLVQGGATGADQIAREWADAQGWRYITHGADWQSHGKMAGPIRNQQMIDINQPQLALCFRLNKSPGASDCLRRLNASKAKHGFPQTIKVFDVDEK